MESNSVRVEKRLCDWYLVSEMVSGSTEMIVGVTTDPVFVPVVAVGMGGTPTGFYRNVATMPAPVWPARAVAMFRKLEMFPLRAGYRGILKEDI